MRFLYSHRTRAADGQYVHIRELTDALKRRGHKIAMAGPDHGDDQRALDAQSGGGGLKSLLPAPVYEFAEYGYSLPAYRRLSRMAAATKPDVLYQRYNLFFHAGAWLKKNHGLPFILEVNSPLVEERTRHGNLALRGFGKRSEAAIWQAADAILPVTGVLAQRLIDAGVDERRIIVIQNGVGDAFLKAVDDSEVRARYGLENKTVLGFTGFVRDWHGVDRVLKFIAEENDKRVHLLLVGDGPERENLTVLAHDLGVADQFTITGVVQRDAMPAHVAAFDIALQPAVVDYASPLKLFEYMGLGKAIVAPASANIKEVLTDRDDALLFRDDAGFAAAMRAVTEDGALRARLGAAAKASLLRQDLTWNGNARRVEAIAEQLLERRQ